MIFARSLQDDKDAEDPVDLLYCLLLKLNDFYRRQLFDLKVFPNDIFRYMSSLLLQYYITKSTAAYTNSNKKYN